MPNSQPYYPKWVVDMFKDNLIRCKQCFRRMTVSDIYSLGVSFPYDNQHYDRSPRGRVSCQCGQCGKPYTFEKPVDKIELFSGVESLYDVIEAEAADRSGDDDNDDEEDHWLPSPNLGVPPGYREKNKHFSFDVVPPENAAPDKQNDSIRRRKRKALDRPPTDREVKAFLNTLKRTSFKLSSKSYAQFMKRLGIDIHWPGEGLIE